MITCTKIYHDIPFAHRQHLHDGHCAFIHGHNWDICLTFACSDTDENGFVVDFGKLGFIKDWINDNLDHACIFSNDDPTAKTLISAAPSVWKTYFLDSCSCEGLAKHLFFEFDELVKNKTSGRVWIASVEVSEDKKNCAKFAHENK